MQLHCHVNAPNFEVRVACDTSKRTTPLHGCKFTISSTANRATYDMTCLSYDTDYDAGFGVPSEDGNVGSLNFSFMNMIWSRSEKNDIKLNCVIGAWPGCAP